MQVQDVTLESHSSPDGDIKMQPHRGVPPKGQRLQDHKHDVTCVVQEEWQMHNTSVTPSIVAQHYIVECHVVSMQECPNQSQTHLVMPMVVPEFLAFFPRRRS